MAKQPQIPVYHSAKLLFPCGQVHAQKQVELYLIMKMHSTLSSSLLALCLAACFSAAQGENGVLKFMMVGDWGGQSKKPYYTESEGRIADQMGKTAADIGANFTIAVGDNFYDDGVADVDDKRFKDTFEVRTDARQKARVHCKRF